MENYTTTQTMENPALNKFFFRSCRVLCSLLRITTHTSIKPCPVQTTARQNTKWFLSVDFLDLKYPTRWNLESEKHDLTSGITSSRDTLSLYSTVRCPWAVFSHLAKLLGAGWRVQSQDQFVSLKLQGGKEVNHKFHNRVAVFGPIYSPNPWLLLLISWLR